MRDNRGNVKNTLNKQKKSGLILFVAIVIISLIAIVFITRWKKVITTETDPSISEASTNIVEDKTACGIKIKFLYNDKYWEKYDLTNAIYKTQGDYETAVCNYIDEIAKLLNKQDWYEQNKDKDTLYIKLEIDGKDNNEATATNLHIENYEDTTPISSNNEKLADYTPKAYLYTMKFNSAMFDHNIVPIVHQLTNLITYNQVDKRSSFSSLLSIGLGEYIQNYLGMGISSCNHGLDIHNYVIEHEKVLESDPTISSYSKAKGLFRAGVTGGISVTIPGGSSVTIPEGSAVTIPVGSAVTIPGDSAVTIPIGSVVVTTVTLPEESKGTPSEGSTVTSSEGITVTKSSQTFTVTSSGGVTITSTSTVDSKNFSIECCSSFVDYLVQTYGLSNTLKMVEGYDQSIFSLYNQNGLDGLISDWQQFLANYPCKMTWADMSAFITEFKSTHGY